MQAKLLDVRHERAHVCVVVVVVVEVVKVGMA